MCHDAGALVFTSSGTSRCRIPSTCQSCYLPKWILTILRHCSEANSESARWGNVLGVNHRQGLPAVPASLKFAQPTQIFLPPPSSLSEFSPSTLPLDNSSDHISAPLRKPSYLSIHRAISSSLCHRTTRLRNKLTNHTTPSSWGKQNPSATCASSNR